MGTVATAMEYLDYLQELGVNAIELMPIQEFSGNNSWGYNPNFYFAPEGVVFIFNPYEIGPYSLGETNICIPVEEISPYVRAEWNLYAND